VEQEQAAIASGSALGEVVVPRTYRAGTDIPKGRDAGRIRTYVAGRDDHTGNIAAASCSCVLEDGGDDVPATSRDHRFRFRSQVKNGIDQRTLPDP